jgi:hypothetical protein
LRNAWTLWPAGGRSTCFVATGYASVPAPNTSDRRHRHRSRSIPPSRATTTLAPRSPLAPTTPSCTDCTAPRRYRFREDRGGEPGRDP